MDEHNDVVILNLDRPRELRLTHAVMKRFCAISHTKLSRMAEAIDDYDKLSLLLWVMLNNDDPSITVEGLDAMIDEAERRKEGRLLLKDVLAAVSTAIRAALGDEEDEEENETPPTAAGTGAKA